MRKFFKLDFYLSPKKLLPNHFPNSPTIIHNDKIYRSIQLTQINHFGLKIFYEVN